MTSPPREAGQEPCPSRSRWPGRFRTFFLAPPPSTSYSVLAIARGGAGVLAPLATEALCAGDILALAGTRDAIAAATDLLTRARAGEPAP